jgi:hypothetical protein
MKYDELKKEDVLFLVECMPLLLFGINKLIAEEKGLSEEEVFKKAYDIAKFKFPSIPYDYFVEACKYAKEYGWNEQ